MPWRCKSQVSHSGIARRARPGTQEHLLRPVLMNLCSWPRASLAKVGPQRNPGTGSRAAPTPRNDKGRRSFAQAVWRFARNCDAAAAVEAAIFSPVFLIFTLGITDLGTGMFLEMQVNAAAQAGASYAVINSGSVCASLSSTCLSSIQTAMNDATGNSSFCTTSAQNLTPCSASFTSCADPNGGICFAISANYPYSPILPAAIYAWARSRTYSSTVTVRVQ